MIGDSFRRKKLNKEFSFRRRGGGKTVEFNYKIIKVGVSLFEAFKLSLIYIFFIRDAINLLEGL
jgi:hypothetical protein